MQTNGVGVSAEERVRMEAGRRAEVEKEGYFSLL